MGKSISRQDIELLRDTGKGIHDKTFFERVLSYMPTDDYYIRREADGWVMYDSVSKQMKAATELLRTDTHASILYDVDKIKQEKVDEEIQKEQEEAAKAKEADPGEICDYSPYDSVEDSKEVWTVTKAKIVNILKYLRQKGITEQEESPEVYRANKLNPSFATQADAVAYAQRSLKINYKKEYSLDTWNPTGCKTDEEYFWMDYLMHLSQDWADARVQEVIDEKERVKQEEANHAKIRANVDTLSQSIIRKYNSLSKKQLRITDMSLQDELRGIIEDFQALRDLAYKGIPLVSFPAFTMEGKPIRYAEGLKKVALFIEKNNLKSYDLEEDEEVGPEQLEKALEAGNARIVSLSNNNTGAKQSFVLGRFGNQVQYAPLRDPSLGGSNITINDQFMHLGEYSPIDMTKFPTGEQLVKLAEGGTIPYSFLDPQEIKEEEEEEVILDPNLQLVSNELKVNHADMLGDNKLADDDWKILAARMAGLVADIGGIGASMVGATPGAVVSDAVALGAHGLADAMDSNVSTADALQHAALNAFSLLVSATPVTGAAKASSKTIKAVRDVIQLGQMVLGMYSLYASAEQYRQAKYSIGQLKMMIDGDIDWVLQDVLVHVKSVMMFASIITNQVRYRGNVLKTVSEGLKDKNTLLKSVGKVSSGVHGGIKKVVSAPAVFAGNAINRKTFGTVDTERIRSKIPEGDSGVFPRLLYGDKKVRGTWQEAIGLRDVAAASEYKALSKKLSPNDPHQALIYENQLKAQYVNSSELDKLRKISTAQRELDKGEASIIKSIEKEGRKKHLLDQLDQVRESKSALNSMFMKKMYNKEVTAADVNRARVSTPGDVLENRTSTTQKAYADLLTKLST